MILATAHPNLVFKWVERWPGYAANEAPPFGGAILTGKHARDVLCVAVKVTAALDTGAACAHAEQEPLVHADQFESDGVLRRPSDFAVERSGTSVLIDGALEQETPALRLEGRVRVGRIDAWLYGWGNRRWEQRDGAWAISEPEVVTRVRLSHRLAYGGPGFTANPVGIGHSSAEPTSGTALARLAPEDRVPGSPTETMAVSLPLPISPAWTPRREAAGTYDATWMREVAPFPAHDQRAEFFDVAPPEFVHRPFLRGGEGMRFDGFAGDAGHVALPRFSFYLLGAGFGVPFQLEIVAIDLLRARCIMTFAARLDVSGCVRSTPPLDVVARRWTERAARTGEGAPP